MVMVFIVASPAKIETTVDRRTVGLMQRPRLLYNGYMFLYFDVVDPRTPWIPEGK